MAQLNDEQIESLYKFTRQHFVEHYDLQTELVDHMANGIEQQWQKFPVLTFEQARDLEFKKFGVFGFMEVVEQRQKAMNKKYTRMVWNHFKNYMKVPKIAAFAASILVTFIILKFTSFSEGFLLGAICTCALIYVAFLLYRSRQIKSHRMVSDKKWMLEDIIFSQGALAGLALIPLHFYNIFSDLSSINAGWILALSLFICSLYLFLYIITIEIPKRAEEYLEATYPEYKMSQ
ncbi:hypothetical protein [Nonlabens agnitus]|uniref:Uncharacterized protein n=1 Tax=Nonlabens agnitus TaxID=870484 RepID=A0A2S9WSE7_9FLAO|nr:hypothetical protein [Nonlabens agnitus]PRP66411.1 hypothetical protein BST86_04550 [Nonlabens agnitus]